MGKALSLTLTLLSLVILIVDAVFFFWLKNTKMTILIAAIFLVVFIAAIVSLIWLNTRKKDEESFYMSETPTEREVGYTDNRHCEKCGVEVSPKDNFCRVCGFELKKKGKRKKR